MGYEIMITPLQLACAYAALANDGLMVRPRFVLSPAELQPPEAIGRVVSVRTARALRRMLEDVVAEGTGKAGRLEGTSAAGKTGTAKKLDPRTKRYSPTAVRATFVGIVPAERPDLVILVTLDEPKVDPWGGLAAAPVFKRIAEQALAYRRAQGHAEPGAGRTARAGGQRAAAPATHASAEGRTQSGAKQGLAGSMRLPVPATSPEQLLGLSVRGVLREARRAGWAVRVEGSGYARSVQVVSSDDRSRVLVVQFEAEALPQNGPQRAFSALDVDADPVPGRDS
jgi:cell division protein FtsI (penicillin-binding protein 3)